MFSESMRFRAFNVGCNFEFVLPNGKVLLVDPWFYKADVPGGFTRDDVTGADYILLTHSHFDHDADLGYLAQKFNAKVFCGPMVYEQLLIFHKISYDNIFPLYPGESYTLEDFKVQAWRAKHNTIGGTYDPNEDISRDMMGIDGHKCLDDIGSMESLDYLITLPNHFRMMFISGVDARQEIFQICEREAPNLLMRQTGSVCVKRPAADTAALIAKYHAQINIPFHFDILRDKLGREKTDAYFQEVRKCLQAQNAGTEFFVPGDGRWYTVGVGINEA